MSELRLNLGASDDKKSGYLSVDIAEPADVVCDLRERWPWEDSSVAAVYAKDVLEHLPMIHALNELHRVMEPGAQVEIIVPCLPGIAPFVDPTHTWPPWTADTRYYFDERWNNPQGERGRLGPAYGITALFRTVGGRSGADWTPIAYAADAPERRKLFLVLEAVK